MATKILVIEDEEKIARFVELELTHEGYEVRKSTDGREGLDLALTGAFDLVLLDIMLPGLNGLEVMRRLRRSSDVPVIMLTARDAVMDKVSGLDMGADDYVTKPFSPAELTARIDALYRRTGGEEGEESVSGELVSGPFKLNTRNRTLEKNGVRIRLTQIEYSIMKLFMDNPGKALSREDILNSVWGRDYFGELKIVDVNIRRLRIKIEDDPTIPSYITTVWGFGYKWGF